MTRQSSRVGAVFTAIALTYGFLIVGSTVVTVAVVLLAGFGIDVTARPALRLVLSTILLQGVAYGGLAVLYLRYRDLGSDFVTLAIPDRRDIAVTAGGIVALLGLLVLASTIISWLGLESAQNQIVTIGNRNPAVFLLLVPLSILVVGPGEELVYRGLVQGTLRASFRPTSAIVLASALFASIHFFSLTGEGKFVYVGIAFALALVLGAAYEYTDNLAVPAVIHGTYNAVQFLIAYLTATGTA